MSYVAMGDHLGSARWLQLLGDTYHIQKNHDAAITALVDAKTLCSATDNRSATVTRLSAYSSISLASIYQWMRNHELAALELTEAEERGRSIGDGDEQIVCSCSKLGPERASSNVARAHPDEALACGNSL